MARVDVGIQRASWRAAIVRVGSLTWQGYSVVKNKLGSQVCCIQILDPRLLIVYPWLNDVTSLSLAFLNYKMGKMVIKIRSSEVQGGTNYVTHA